MGSKLFVCCWSHDERMVRVLVDGEERWVEVTYTADGRGWVVVGGVRHCVWA